MCSQHVRKSRLHQWRYEIEHGADLSAKVNGRNILEHMAVSLSFLPHSRAGHRAVHQLLVDSGAPAVPYAPIAYPDFGNHGPVHIPFQRLDEAMDTDKYDTDVEALSDEDADATA